MEMKRQINMWYPRKNPNDKEATTTMRWRKMSQKMAKVIKNENESITKQSELKKKQKTSRK